MLVNDSINSLFEGIGALFVWRNVWQLFKDRAVRGVYWPTWAFFSAWGLWNLYYYPSLDQWFSFSAGVLLASGNITWCIMAFLFHQKKRR